ncbi:hypothetical protein ASD15_29350 [Massilia sp. Root351]|jgi:hypothetical protein|uniref:hypothetical protein n=1 Tax=Massilia sp. Root351 TaxID=1736522 RepID=UPI0007110330|nr:hypothetical protein [Massilia sp. Root351]KQV86689.1 hypothetical protein ASD15_29350 [Massilia sp. Root351]
MPAHITIRDGSPYWWASTDIWVVPGADPNGAPGTPVAGQPAYLWAHAVNSGNTVANGTRIDFYWADPSAQVVVGTANPIGSAFVDLDLDPAGQDVLCLVPWVPVIVNGGHECLLAVAHSPGDSNPIPDPLPNGYVFDPPAHDQIAQRNITVLMASMLAAAMVISVRALPRQDKEAFISVEYGGELDQRQMALLGLDKLDLRPAPQRSVQVELSLEPVCGGKHRHGPDRGDSAGTGGGEAGRQGGQEQVLAVSMSKTYAAGSEVGGDETLEQEPGVVEDDMGAAGGAARPGGAAAGSGAVHSGEPEGADYGRHGGRGLRVNLRRGMAAAVYAAFSADGLRPGQYQLVHIIERSQGKVVGGVSYVVARPNPGQGEKK